MSNNFAVTLNTYSLYKETVLKLSKLPYKFDIKPINYNRYTMVSGKWTGQEFSLICKSTIFTKYIEGDKGNSIDYAGSHIYLVNVDRDVVYIDILNRLIPVLLKQDYRGFINIHLDDKYKVIDIYTGVKNLYPLLELCPDLQIPKYQNMMAIGIRFSKFPGYDLEKPYNISNLVNPENRRHIHFPQEYYKFDTDEVSNFNLGIVTARGINLHECRKRALRTLKNLNILNIQYRTDI